MLKDVARTHPGDQGQLVPLVAALIVLCAGLILGLATLGHGVIESQRTQATADAAALAAVIAAGPDKGGAAAQQIAVRSGCSLETLVREHSDVLVTVHCRGLRARARARAGGAVP